MVLLRRQRVLPGPICAVAVTFALDLAHLVAASASGSQFESAVSESPTPLRALFREITVELIASNDSVCGWSLHRQPSEAAGLQPAPTGAITRWAGVPLCQRRRGVTGHEHMRGWTTRTTEHKRSQLHRPRRPAALPSERSGQNGRQLTRPASSTMATR